ncbi:hypothetical protein FGG08_003389 [Glutinoglossum americanum]|uniref:Protein YOP1 n=1 Tax=Glutinoglossum americanum TaxID=1670608 RepID=A0A9P8I7C5_9PEZI|nr:hypothetical protein FGG08_003389 [Glutinoglossum americanum]
MFDLVAKLLSSIATFLFPIFASYKALQANDPAQLTPWLMYWVVFNCALLFESWTEWILVWVPFYAWIRLSILLYLVLPQTQGAKLVYIQYIHPFLRDHEAEIEAFIAKSMDRARAAGLQYYRRIVEAAKEFLGVEVMQQQQPPTPPPTMQSTGAYVQTLLSRFNLPSAAAAATSFLQQQQQQQQPSSLFPPYPQPRESETPTQRLASLAAHRAHFYTILQSLDREAQALDPSSSLLPPGSESPTSIATDDQSLKKSKSELEFERVEREDLGEDARGQAKGGGGGWLPWGWGGKGAVPGTQEAAEQEEELEGRGTATGVDPRWDPSSSVQHRHGQWQGQP